MKQYRASSPSMNDQWSGKTLFSVRRAKLAAPSRSSNHLNSRRITLRLPPSRPASAGPAPPARAHRLAEVTAGPQEPRLVGLQRELRQRPRRRPEHDLRAVEDVERRLVARALHLVQLLHEQP